MIIDFHTHLADISCFPDFFINGIKEELADDLKLSLNQLSNNTFLLKIINNILSDQNCSRLLKQMEEANIDKSILLVPDMFLFKDIEDDSDNEKIIAIHKKYFDVINKSDKLIGFSGIDPRRKIGFDLFKTEIENFGFKGLKLYPPCGFEINDDLLTPFFNFCNELDLPVLIHTGPSLKGMFNTFETFKIIKQISAKYSRINFVLAHAGILYIERIIEDVIQSDNIYVDVSGFQKISHNDEALKIKFTLLQDKIPEKVLYGSDWPLYNFNCSQKKWIKKICNIDSLTDNFKKNLFTENAKKILKMS